jgi:hypothetical protein
MQEGGNAMELKVQDRADIGLLYATLSGDFSLAEAKRTFLQILAAVERHQAGKVLVDGRGVTGKLTAMERFHYGEFVAATVLDMRLKVGMCDPRFSFVLVEPVLDPDRLGETVAVNRGLHVRAFDNLDDALGWLDIESSGDLI